MGRKRKYINCANCNKRILIAEAIIVANDYYCPQCAKKTTSEDEAKAALIDYIDLKFNFTPEEREIAIKKVNNCKRYQKWKYSMMLEALQYGFDPKNNNLAPEGVRLTVTGMLDYYYPIVARYHRLVNAVNGLSPSVLGLVAQPTKEIYVDKDEVIKVDKYILERAKNNLYGPPINFDDDEEEIIDYNEDRASTNELEW